MAKIEGKAVFVYLARRKFQNLKEHDPLRNALQEARINGLGEKDEIVILARENLKKAIQGIADEFGLTYDEVLYAN